VSRKTKLELTWVGKENRPRLEPRVLIEEPGLSHAAGVGIMDNLLVQGDNLLALKALEADYSGRVKCVFIDPPYNTGAAFEHYDDGLEHSIWLSMMRDRLEVIRNLLSPDGSLWVTLDDNETHYFKVMTDEVFGRRNFVANVVWEKADSPRMDARTFSTRHDHVLVYAKDIDQIVVKQVATEGEEIPSHYSKKDELGRPYYLKPLRAMGVDGTREARPSMYFGIKAPDGELVFPKNPNGSDSRWRWSPDRVQQDLDRLEWVTGRNGWGLFFRIYAENNQAAPAGNDMAARDGRQQSDCKGRS